jgi:FkbM family methyltransferase
VNVVASASRVLPDKAFCRAVAVAHRRAEPEMTAVIAACDPDGVAVDVGAWFGPWSYWLSRRVESVVAFEPNPAVAAVLDRWLGATVDVRPVALSDTAGNGRLAISGRTRGEEGESHLGTGDGGVPVAVSTLDAQGLERVRLLKIDVEGHELGVLEGARNTLEEWHPVVVVELESRQSDVAGAFGLLASTGFQARVFVDGRWERTGPDELVNRQRRSRRPPGGYAGSVVRKGNGYVNNVLFVHPESTWVPW